MPAGISQIESSQVRHVPVLHFFNVGSPASATSITVADFGMLLGWLASSGYAPQKLSDYIRWMRGEIDLPRKSVVLVFSSVLESQYSEAYRLLKPYNWPFNLTIPGSMVENEAILEPGGGGLKDIDTWGTGINYQVDDILTLIDGHGTGGQVRVSAVGPNGVPHVVIWSEGSGYSAGDVCPTSGGHGFGCHVFVLSVWAGNYLTLANLVEMVGSGLCELHSEGYHAEYFFEGNAANIQQLYKAAQVNLKWGGAGELVENLYGYAPLIGTNSALAAVTTVYTFQCTPRSYRPNALNPLQVVASYLVVDRLQVVGTRPGTAPLVNIYAKKHADAGYTLIKTGWQPSWSAAYAVITLDAPFTFKAGYEYDLEFVTQSAAGAAGELVTVGNITAAQPPDPNSLPLATQVLLQSPPPPSLGYTPGGSLAQRTYWVKTTQTSIYGETLASRESAITVPANNLLQVYSFAPGPYGTSWSVYAWPWTGAEELQVSGILFSSGLGWTEPTGGLISGAAPPVSIPAVLAPPAGPALSTIAGGTLGARTYWVEVTYVNDSGETQPSSECVIAVSAGYLLNVASPAPEGSATHWNVYIADTTTGEVLQNAAPIPIGVSWTEPLYGLVGTQQPPNWNTAYTPVPTMCVSNSSVPWQNWPAGAQDGGDIYLLESLVQETLADTAARVLADAQANLDFLAPYQPQSQNRELAYYYPYDTIGTTGLFLPSTLRQLHTLQLYFAGWLADRWSEIDLYTGRAVYPAADFPKRQLTPTFLVDGTRAVAQLENQIDSYSGTLWDAAPDWDQFAVTFGWVNEWSGDYATELKKYASAFTYIGSTLVGFNTDGITFPSADVAKLVAFMDVGARRGVSVLIQIGDYSPQQTTMHNIFSNPTQSIAAIVNLLLNSAPTAAGVALNLEGAAYTDRSIANAWAAQLRATFNAQLPGRIIIFGSPDKTSDNPTGYWDGWCEWSVWGANVDYVFLPLYANSDQATTPGPSCVWSWMHDVLSYAVSQIPQAKIMPGFGVYGTRWTGGPGWGSPPADYPAFYDDLKRAYDHNATWHWDATNHEWYWVSADGTEEGYQPTPQALADRLSDWLSLGFSTFGIWAIGQGDALFYKDAEMPTAIAPLVKLPTGPAQRINDREGSGSIGDFEIEVLEDPANSLAGVMVQEQLHGKHARFRLGYAGINPPQFPAFDTFEVDRVEVNDDLTGWKLQLVDTKRSTKSRIFTAATKEEPVILLGNPMDILLAVYQNELGVGQMPNVSSDAWLLYDGAGAAYLRQLAAQRGMTYFPSVLINPNRYLDVPAILAYRAGLFAGYYMEFTITEPQDAKGWLEKEIYKALGGYPMVNAQGQISPRFWVGPGLAPASVFSFTDHNLVKLPICERASIVNQVVFRMDYDGSKFQTVLLILDSDSIRTYGLQGQQIIESKGLRASRQGSMHANLLATKLFRRYASIVPIWTVEAFHQALVVEVGDLVALTHAKALDPVANTRGISNVLCEVLEKQPDYTGGRVTFKLLDARYLAGLTPYAIAPIGIPAWPQASAEQRATYMFCASDSSGLMNDGATPGNPIYG
jgi:hypothetical protein